MTSHISQVSLRSPCGDKDCGEAVVGFATDTLGVAMWTKADGATEGTVAGLYIGIRIEICRLGLFEVPVRAAFTARAYEPT